MPTAPLLGINFGTSNSAAALLIDGEAAPVPLDGDRAIMPSAVFIGPDGVLCGKAAFDADVANEEGRFMRGLKSLLGSPLLHQTTVAAGRRWRFSDIIADRTGVSHDAIETLLWMGASSLFPPFRAALEARLPKAQTVSEDLMGSVSRGLVLGETKLS